MGLSLKSPIPGDLDISKLNFGFCNTVQCQFLAVRFYTWSTAALCRQAADLLALQFR